jgi:hypothetical protein
MRAARLLTERSEVSSLKLTLALHSKRFGMAGISDQRLLERGMQLIKGLDHSSS